MVQHMSCWHVATVMLDYYNIELKHHNMTLLHPNKRSVLTLTELPNRSMNKDPVFGMGPNENNIPKPYLRIRKPNVLRVRPSNLGVITYYFVGFGDTGKS